MKISIITICYNSAETIEDTIKSVASQSHDDVEYIIVDGASKDNTLEIVNKYKEHISTIISEPDKGIYDAMNKGVQAASGEVIGILNSDDFYAHDDVLKDIDKLFRRTEAEAVYADLVYVNRDNTNEVIRYWKSGPYKVGHFEKGWMPPHPTFFLKKECYDEYGIYSTKLRSAADYELMLRMIRKEGVSVAYHPEVITKMRVGGQSNVTLKNRWKANREDREAWRMNGLQPRPLTLIRKPLSKISQYFKK